MSRKLAFTTRLTRDDVAGIMEAMMDGMREGLLKVQKSDETLEMAVPRVIDLEVRAALDNERARCALEVSWRPHREENPDVPDADEAQFREIGEPSAGEHARASIREAARAARKAAKNAGLVLEKTARAASVLVREGVDKGKAGVGGGKDGGGLLSQMTAKVEAVARRARKAVRGVAGGGREEENSGVCAPQACFPEPASGESPSASPPPDALAPEASVPDASAPETAAPEPAAREKAVKAAPVRKKAAASSRAKVSAAASEGTRKGSAGTGAKRSESGKAKPEA
jgi:amphi-Trp domain-containing protein